MRTQLTPLTGQFKLLRETESKRVWQHISTPNLEIVAPIGVDPWAKQVGVRVAIQRGKNRNGSEYSKALRLLVSEELDGQKVQVSVQTDRAGVFVSPEGAILFAVIPAADRTAILISILEVSSG